jgi:hypothetical protein
MVNAVRSWYCCATWYTRPLMGPIAHEARRQVGRASQAIWAGGIDQFEGAIALCQGPGLLFSCG